MSEAITGPQAEAAWRALAGPCIDADRRLDDAPPREQRSAAQQQVLDEAVNEARRVRTVFLARYAAAVYGTVANQRAGALSRLAFAVAERFPALVPGPAQMQAENRLPQGAKHGREIDQAILFHAWLKHPETGAALIRRMRRPTPEGRDRLPAFQETGRADLGPVTLERRAGAGFVTFTNSASLNAEDDALIEALQTAVDLVLLDDGTRVGVLRGGPMTHPKYAGRRVFSAGINLVDLAAGRISYLDFLLGRELGYLGKIQRGLQPEPGTWPGRPVSKPWIGAVDGFAIGGGMQLLLVCDQVIAASDAHFSLPAAQEGIVPGVANLRLRAQLGHRLTRQIILSGRTLRATDPEAALLCDRIVQPEAMDAEIDRAVAELAAPAVAANRAMLTLAEEPDSALREYLAEFAITQALRVYAPDVLAKTTRFAQRAPRE